MSLPRAFLNRANFERAFNRIVRGMNRDYKQFYRHLFQSYKLSLRYNIDDLIKDIKKGLYSPSQPTIVFLPKKSGILRPLTLLQFRDLIVYQAIVNVIADQMESLQQQYAYTKCYGAIYAGPGSPFFFRSWKKGYQEYNEKIDKHFHKGNVYVADFDLVSCYELIDHNLLISCISKKVKSKELLLFLSKCLSQWTTNVSGKHLRHGLPQGPEASAFLAECMLFKFDETKFNKDVRYVRYIDDIKLMAKSGIPLRRALLKLDLISKELGLVPQAQKINLGKIDKIEEITKTIPSAIAQEVDKSISESQSQIREMLKNSLAREKGKLVIKDDTKFKYSILRINPRKDILRKIRSLLVDRPDCSYVLSHYLKQFPESKEAADILLEALQKDPTYDASAAHYIEAMDVCEPASNNKVYRQVIHTAKRRSEENSILLSLAILTFRARRFGPTDTIRMFEKEQSSLVRGLALHRIFGDHQAPYRISTCIKFLEKQIEGNDEDLARYCALHRLHESFKEKNIWTPKVKSHNSVHILFRGLDLPSRGPRKKSVLEGFFGTIGLNPRLNWKKVLGGNFANAEHRCLRLQELSIGDPTARILMLDTFNETLIQSFSVSHPTYSGYYQNAAGRNAHPDYGNWLNNGHFAQALPDSLGWFQQVHEARVKADLAHAKTKKGKSTKSISFERSDQLFNGGKRGWGELFREWRKVI